MRAGCSFSAHGQPVLGTTETVHFADGGPHVLAHELRLPLSVPRK